MKQIIAIGNDHGGLPLKEALVAYLQKKPLLQLQNLGANSSDSVDYPDMADPVVNAILRGNATAGILICGTGIGISMKANRFKGIRAALVYNAFSAEMAKRHNNANILCLGGRTCSIEEACHWIDTWLNSPFEGGRHSIRLAKLDT